MKTDEQTDTLDNLHQLLERQIKLALKGNYKAVEELALEADSEIKKGITIKKITRDAKSRYEQVLNLYKKLELMLNTEKDIVKNQQKAVDNVRKSLSAYNN